jgi:hypothetical protein
LRTNALGFNGQNPDIHKVHSLHIMNEISATQRPGSTGNLQRVGFLALLPRLLRSFGVEPTPVLSAVGLQDNALDDPNKAIPYVTMGRLMERAAQATGCSTFGLELGKTIGLSTLGPVGELMRNSPTVRAALQTFATSSQRPRRCCLLDRGFRAHIVRLRSL